MEFQPGNANLPIGSLQDAIQENGVPGLPATESREKCALILLIFFAAAVHCFANNAQRRRFRVIHNMVDGLDRLQISENGLQVVIRHAAVMAPGHDLIQRPRLDVSGTHRL